MTRFVPVLAGVSMLAMASIANAGEPAQLTLSQMDGVTAGASSGFTLGAALGIALGIVNGVTSNEQSSANTVHPTGGANSTSKVKGTASGNLLAAVGGLTFGLAAFSN